MIESKDIVQAIRAAAAHSRPFPHLRLSDVFGGEDYREILRLLPPRHAYSELRHKDARLPDGTYSRLEFSLTLERMERLDRDRRRFWAGVADALRHPDIAREFAARFAELGCQVPIESGSVLRLSLTRDFPGYSIRPHQDIPSKLLTVQIYLPPDDRGSAMGTNFYRRGAAKVLERDVSVPYLPNTGYAFAVTENSWHGVDTIPPGAPDRDSLMLVWNAEGAAAKLATSARLTLRRLRSGGRPPSVTR